MGKLETALIKVKGCRIVPRADWDDNLSDLLKDENLVFKWEKNILIINDEAEVAHIDIDGISWQVCFKWVPLWRLRYYSDCLVSNWRDLYPTQDLFAIPDSDEDLKGTRTRLEAVGFVTDSFEGF